MFAGDYTGRMQNALDFYLTQGTELGVRMEIIIVEWNPLATNARLIELLRTPPKCSIPVRIITVGADFHRQVEGGTGESFFEFMAKNVGARRSRSVVGNRPNASRLSRLLHESPPTSYMPLMLRAGSILQGKIRSAHQWR